MIVEHEGAIRELWEELKEMTDARSMALAGAKEIHIFNKEAADTRSLIQVRFLGKVEVSSGELGVAIVLHSHTLTFLWRVW